MASPPAQSPSLEIQAAASYITSHLSALSLPSETQASLSNSLTSTLQAKYDSHWHPSDPERGSAYRALTRQGNTLDDILVNSLKAAKIPLSEASKALAASMACDKWTLWVDPGCVSIRMHGAANTGGIQYNSSSLDTTTASPAASNTSKVTISGITEIWGKLPSSVTAVIGAVGQAPSAAIPPKSARKSKSVISLSAAAKLSMEEEASVAAEFEALALNASPAGASKKSKAIAIMKPVVHRGVASVASSDSVSLVASTPPRPLPPLCFTIQESTSPYVPSFATTAATTVKAGDSASTSSSGNTITRATTPSMLGRLTSPPLYTSDSITSSCSSSSSNSDPFARPSSRSSTTSLNSATSCSIFSHASSDSRSSSIGSFTTEEALSDKEAGNTTITATVTKASKGEMEAAKSFTFPSSGTALKADTLALLPLATAPNSPSKSNTRRRHDRSASIVSAASSSASHHSSQSHSRTRPSSRTEVRVEKETKPQEYSNGKVGVLGGGVMLGPKKDASSSSARPNHNRSHSTASSNNGGMATLNIAKTNSRPSKARTTSSGSNSSDYLHQHGQYQHYNPAGAYTHQPQAGAYNWAHYPAPPAQIPHQYRY